MWTNGYIKEYRSLLSWGWFKDPFTAHLWEYLRLAANWDEAVFKGKPVRRGELVTSYSAMAEATGMSVQNVRTAIRHLKQTGEIEMKSFRDFSIVTVVNYDRYQADNSLDNGQLTGCQQADSRQPITIAESKKARKQESKKGREGAPVPDLAERFSEPALSAVRDWITYKQERREAYKAVGLKSLLTEIENRVKRHGAAAVAEVIRLSMANNWKGIIWDRIKDAPKEAKTEPEETPDWEIAWRAQKEEIRRKMREEGYER